MVSASPHPSRADRVGVAIASAHRPAHARTLRPRCKSTARPGEAACAMHRLPRTWRTRVDWHARPAGRLAVASRPASSTTGVPRLTGVPVASTSRLLGATSLPAGARRAEVCSACLSEQLRHRLLERRLSTSSPLRRPPPDPPRPSQASNPAPETASPQPAKQHEPPNSSSPSSSSVQAPAKRLDTSVADVDKDLGKQRRQDWRILRKLVPNIWPKGDTGTKVRVVTALTLLVGAKVRPSAFAVRTWAAALTRRERQLMNVQVPFYFKQIVDTLSSPIDPSTPEGLWTVAGTVIVGCTSLRPLLFSSVLTRRAQMASRGSSPRPSRNSGPPSSLMSLSRPFAGSLVAFSRTS